MPMSGAERTKLYRERLKARCGPWNVKAADAQRKAESRKKDLEKSRQQERDRQQRCRQIKRQAANCDAGTPSQASGSPAYKSSSSLGKAVKRAQSSLPKPPRKRQKVVRKLVVKFLPPNTSSSELKNSSKQSHNKLSDDDSAEIQAFYMRSDVSWTAPGKKDYVTVIKNGEKQKEQKKFMLMSLCEAHQLFVEAHPAVKVGRSKFAALRPKTVMCNQAIPHNLCICKYHANVDLLLDSLHTVSSLTSSHRELLAQVVCDVNNEECMFDRCQLCKGHCDAEYFQISIEDTTLQIKWYQWMRTEEGQTVKVAQTGTVHDAVILLAQQLVFFKKHAFIKKKQADYFYTLHHFPGENQAVVQVDFSENASIVCQDEVQSAHWSHAQVALYTVVAWTPEGTYSYAIISDYLSHDKYAVQHFNSIIITNIKDRMKGTLQKVDIFSDGAAQHFKQRYIFYTATTFHQKGIQVNWHFFATSHGKGAVDGVGGTVKRAVHIAIKSRQVNVSDAKEYAESAKKLLSKITVIYVPSDDISLKKAELDSGWLDVRSIPGTHDIHCIKTVAVGVVEYSVMSEKPGQKFHLSSISDDDSEPQESVVQREDVLINQSNTPASAQLATEPEVKLCKDVKPGEWVAAIYDDDWYPGLVENAESGILTVSFMQKAGEGGKFRWPQKADLQQLPESELLCRLDTSPRPSSWSTRVFVVDQWEQIKLMSEHV